MCYIHIRASPGLKRGIIQHFIASFEILCTCRRDEVVGERSCVVPAAFLLLFRKCSFHDSPSFISTWSSNTECMSTRRYLKERRMHRLTYACHVTRTWSRDTHSTWRNHVFNRSFRRKDAHFLTGKKKSSNSSVGLKKLDDKWSLNSANFCRCRSCDFIDLNTTTGKQIPRRDWFS